MYKYTVEIYLDNGDMEAFILIAPSLEVAISIVSETHEKGTFSVLGY